MSLDRSAIFVAAQSYSEYSNGLALYRAGKADAYHEERINATTYSFNGAVRLENQAFYTKTIAGKDSFTASFCTCGSSGSGLCAHQVAVALDWLEHHADAFQEQAETDEDFALMLKTYQQIATEVLEQDLSQQTEPIRLEPVISFKGMLAPQLGLRIGTDKLYVVKDLVALYQAYANHTEFIAGKNCSFVPGDEAFLPEDLALFRFICRKAEYVLANRGGAQYTGYKMFSMTPSDRDDVFPAYIGKTLQIETAYGSSKVQVTDENPRMIFPVSSPQENCILIGTGSEDWAVYPGAKGLYVLKDDQLYCCSQTYTKRCATFLETLQMIRNSGRERITLARQDAANFCVNVLPYIEDYIEIDESDCSLKDYKPAKLEASFYFDMPEPQTLLCEVQYRYGDQVINPLTSENRDVLRNELLERSIDRVIGQYFHFKDEKNRLIIQNKDDQIFAVLDHGLTEFMHYGTVYISDAMKAVRVSHPPKVSVGVSIQGDLLNLKIDAGGLSSEELNELLEGYRAKKRFFRLKNGDFIQFKEDETYEELNAAGDLVEGLRLKNKSVSEGVELPKNRAFYIEQILNENQAVQRQEDEAYKNLTRSLISGQHREYSLPEELHAELRHYQMEGFQWLRTLHEYGLGGILADDMGLGKTLQIITLLLSCKEQNRTSLICCPASLVYNWYNEFHRFAPSLACRIVTGEQSERMAILQDYEQADVLITSYDVLRRDVELYEHCHFLFQVVDEAQFIKNQNTQKAQAVKEIQADTRFALTGTPIENRLSELWSIFDYLMPGYLYSYQMFKAVLETPIVKEHDEEALARLQKLIAPFILRRLKRDVLQDLPDKLEEVVYSRMEGEQKKLYAAVTNRLIKSLNDASVADYNTSKIQILAELTRLRQLCCDPSLIYENYTAGSVKLDTCMQLVEQGIEGGHKMLIFSQFTSMLQLIGTALVEKGIKYHILTGETPVKERPGLVEAFQEDDTPVFLISLKAGGTGLNLTAADIVIHYDPWWNVAAQNQATDRSHRIGQENTVNVYKLIVKDTIEDKILQLQEAKKQLADDILSGEQTSIASLGKEELLELLQ
jgi:SNF2 family DNA or RNA helicase